MVKPVDLLLTNAILLTMDETLSQFENGAVAVSGDSIVAAGPEAELRKQFEAKETMDCGGKVLMPGLVNAHTHVPMTLLRGLADDLRLDVWLMGYIMPVEREFVNPEFVRLGASIGCAEFIRSGVTTFADMYYYESAVAEATAAAGLRAVCGQTIMRFPAPDAQSYEDSLAATREFIEKWLHHPLSCLRFRRMRLIAAPKRSCAPPLLWQPSSTFRCTPTYLKPHSKWKTPAATGACRSCPTSRNRISSTPKCWPPIAST